MDKEELKQNYASIHTLRMEGDGRKLVLTFNISGFQSTPSAWRVTFVIIYFANRSMISIHTLHMEGDQK